MRLLSTLGWTVTKLSGGDVVGQRGIVNPRLYLFVGRGHAAHSLSAENRGLYNGSGYQGVEWKLVQSPVQRGLKDQRPRLLTSDINAVSSGALLEGPGVYITLSRSSKSFLFGYSIISLNDSGYSIVSLNDDVASILWPFPTLAVTSLLDAELAIRPCPLSLRRMNLVFLAFRLVRYERLQPVI